MTQQSKSQIESVEFTIKLKKPPNLRWLSKVIYFSNLISNHNLKNKLIVIN